MVYPMKYASLIMNCVASLVPRVTHLTTRDPGNAVVALPYLRQRYTCGNAFIRKKKVLSADFKESEDAEISKETVKLFTGNLMGRNNPFISLICR